MKILIVEDEIRIREGLSRLIKKLRPEYEIVGEAENGEEGIRIAREAHPDVIITDIKMPVMDGLEMLTLLCREENKMKAIVLSAYSEFEYARRAIRLGVKEYLLKPLVVGDVSEALRRVEDEICQEKSMTEETYGSLEQIFAGILWGGLDADKAMQERLAVHFSIPEGTVYSGICVYLGERYEKEKQKAKKELEHLISERGGAQYVILEADREKMLLLLVYQERDSQGLERWVQYWLLQDRGREVKGAVGFIAELALEALKDGLETLLSYMDWNISLGDDVMISYPKITRLQTNPCIYPLDIEKRMKLALCSAQREKVRKSLDDFHEYFYTGIVYAPREIKECYVRFLWALINTGKEVGILNYEDLEQQRLLERIMGAKTSEELRAVGKFLEQNLSDGEEEATHLTIKRAQSLIQEFYQSGITLEEIASKLNITPEYLGTKFHREMGMTFGAYMKNFRVTKAKELLIGTTLKQYEIASKVGYSDPKYFSKVFKEATGQLPADYRKAHK